LGVVVLLSIPLLARIIVAYALIQSILHKTDYWNGLVADTSPASRRRRDGRAGL
jgi:hypothetical protein